MHTVKAFLIAPILGLFIAAVMVLPWVGEINLLVLYLFFGAFYVYPTALLVGLPLYFAVKRRIRPLRHWHYAVGGIVSSLPMIYLIFQVENTARDAGQRLVTNTILCLVTGLTAGLVFGILIGRFERRQESVPALEQHVEADRE